MCLNDFYATLLRTGKDDTLVVCPKGQEEAFNILQYSRPFVWKQLKDAASKKAVFMGDNTFILVSIFINENCVEKIASPEYAAIAVEHNENICIKSNIASSFDDDVELHYSNIHVLVTP